MSTWRLLGEALGRIGSWLSRYAAAVLLVHGAVILLIGFALLPLFDLALERAGQSGITTASALAVLTDPVSLLLLIGVVLVASVGVLLELGVLMSMARQQRSSGVLRLRTIVRDVAHVARRLLTPGVAALVPYLFLLVPLGGLGLASLLTRGIEVPAFITGELMRFPGGGALSAGILLVLFWLNLRFLLVVPVLMSGEEGVFAAFGQSWRLTRWQSLRLAVILGTVAIAALVVLAGVTSFGVLPTEYTDRHLPEASILVGGASLTVMQAAATLVSGLALATVVVVQLTLLVQRRGDATVPDAHPPAERTRAAALADERPLATRIVLGATAVVVLAGATAANSGALLDLGRETDTLLLAHRGDVQQGAENSLEALEGAAAVGADLVEMDVQWTADGRFVVIHDATLGRLAGQSTRVDQLTLDELTSLTVSAQGFRARLPDFEEYLVRAAELDQPLLIELKPTGREPEEYPQAFLDVLREHDALDGTIVQSLDADLVETLAALEPRLSLGYVLPLNLGHLPETSADVIVVEDFSYSRNLLAEAQARGKRVFVWTVNSDALLRAYLREGVDGIITDATARAVELRAEIAADTSVTARLQDQVRMLFP